MSEFNVIADLVRTLDKVAEVLGRVDTMMSAEAEMNAAKHLSNQVLPNPLAAAVSTTITGVEFALERGRSALQGELPLEFPDVEKTVTWPPSEAERLYPGATISSAKAVVEWADPWADQ